MSSILTNNSAMVALQTLKTINNDLSKTQDMISTGKAIGSAKDNAAVWSIATKMSSDANMFNTISDELGVGKATVDVALAGIDQLTGTLDEIEALAVSGKSEGADFTKINEQIEALKEKMDSVVTNSQFNGINLLNDTVDGTSASLNIASSVVRATPGGDSTVDTIEVSATNLSGAGVNNVTFTPLDGTSTTADTVIGEIQAMRTAVLTAGADLGAKSAQIGDQMKFVSAMGDALKAGISVMTDANMEEASAKLQALQVQQQLATQSLSIANQAPQNILSLFR
ncbi:flagellin [Rhodovulum bhavnagarense]|uniref:Flagellin n=1 Tax=Rhodovulum bhavnagarense TaxID=992286 RepID=A0A4R2RFS6_9RHOB|nr:flagellin [Rhodovulum bhavnagarense]TCP61199.1 flagellin [Rhodovulum bhavnagarense]